MLSRTTRPLANSAKSVRALSGKSWQGSDEEAQRNAQVAMVSTEAFSPFA